MKIWLERDSLQRLANISEHRYSIFLTQITFGMHRLNPYTYNGEVPPDSDDLVRLHSEVETIARARRLVDHLEYQKKMEKEGLDIVLLSTAMRKLPKLSTVIFDSHPSIPVFTQSVKISYEGGFNVVEPGPEWRRHVLQVGLQALARADCQPRTIMIDTNEYEECFMPCWAFEDLSILIPMAGLRSLVHNLHTFIFDGDVAYESMLEYSLHGVALGRFLEHASQLEELHLRINGCFAEENSLSALVGQGQYPRLRKFTLINYGTSTRELATWLPLHSSSLERIILQCLGLVHGQWDEFLDLLRTSSWLLLSHMDFYENSTFTSDGNEDFWISDHGSAPLVDYLQGRTDINPYHVYTS